MYKILCNSVIKYGLISFLLGISITSCSSSAESEAYSKAKLFEWERNNRQIVKWYTKAAEQGHLESQFNLGEIYLNGRYGQPKDKYEAEYWLGKAAAQGHAKAHISWSRLYVGSDSVFEDHKLHGNIEQKGIDLLQDEVAQGNPAAMLALSKQYELRATDKFDELQKKAIETYNDLAESGDVNSQMWLVKQYRSEYSVTGKNHELEFKWLSAAAESGDANAQYLLSRVLRVSHRGGKPNPHQNKEKALYWERKAANSGHMVALSTMALHYRLGMYGLKKDIKKMVQLETESAELGYPSAMATLGTTFAFRGEYIDVEAALYWTKKAAQEGSSLALSNLSYMYEQGIGVTQDIVTALVLDKVNFKLGGKPDKKSVRRRVLAAEKQFGKNPDNKTMEKFDLLEKEIKEKYGPSALYRVACEEGSSRSCMKLGLSYAMGYSVDKDLKKAGLLFQQACEKEVHQSCVYLRHLDEGKMDNVKEPGTDNRTEKNPDTARVQEQTAGKHITGAHIYRWEWMVLSRVRYSSQKSVAYIIITNGWRHDCV